MGLVPFATPQTFSRIVVFPAFALPITRMRKCGHLYRSLSTFIFSSLISDRHQSIFTDTHFDLLIETGFRDISEAESAIAIFVLGQKRQQMMRRRGETSRKAGGAVSVVGNG